MGDIWESLLEAARALRSFLLLGEMRESFRGGDSEWNREREDQVWGWKGPPEGGGHTVVGLNLPCKQRRLWLGILGRWLLGVDGIMLGDESGAPPWCGQRNDDVICRKNKDKALRCLFLEFLVSASPSCHADPTGPVFLLLMLFPFSVGYLHSTKTL